MFIKEWCIRIVDPKGGKNMHSKRKKKEKRLTSKDMLENPIYQEMMEIADDVAGRLTSGYKKCTI